MAVTTDRGEVLGAYAVVAVPPTLAGRISYDPLLPAARDQLTQRMPDGQRHQGPRALRRAVLARRRAHRAGHERPRRRCGSPSTTRPPDGSAARCSPSSRAPRRGTGARRTRADRHAWSSPTFARYFGRRAGNHAEIVEQDWSTEEWTRGCYGAHLAPGVWTAYGPALRTPCGRIHWAGTETASVWTGYLDGAVRSGERAASDPTALLGATAAPGSPS